MRTFVKSIQCTSLDEDLHISLLNSGGHTNNTFLSSPSLFLTVPSYNPA